MELINKISVTFPMPNKTSDSVLLVLCIKGAVDPSHILEQIELQIGNVKEEALSRKEILERVEKWMAACEEECWLEEYNRVQCFLSLCLGC